jgi:hypothetical protein
MANQGVLYVAYGDGAIRETKASIETLRKQHDWPVSVISDRPIEGAKHIHKAEFPGAVSGGRWAKVNLDLLSPYDNTLFLDADTRIFGKLDVGFNLLANGWELVMVPSISQGEKALHHLNEVDRLATFQEAPGVLQLNTGVMWFRKTRHTATLFRAWRKEWKRFKDKDQGALLRALVCNPVALYLLGRDYNGGTIVQHRYGACKRA